MADLIFTGNMLPYAPNQNLGEAGRLWNVLLDASGFSGQLNSSHTTLQQIANVLDALTLPSGGGGVARDTVLQLIAQQIPTWTGQKLATDLIPLSKLNAVIAILVKAYLMGGPRPYTGNDIQLGQTKDSAYTAAQFTAIPANEWSNTGTQASGSQTEIGPQAYAALRISRTAEPMAPAVLPSGYGLRASPTLPFVANPVLTRLPTADTATHWAYSVSYGTQPADDDLVLEVDAHGTFRILPPNDSLTWQMLMGLSAAAPGQVIETGLDGAFRTASPGGLRLVHSGSTGVTTNSLSANSGIQTYEFDQSIDLDTAGDGILIVDDRLRIVVGPAALSFSPTAIVKTINARGQLSLQQIGFEGVYNGGSEIGAKIIDQACYMGATKVGAFVRRVARDAGRELEGNVRYDFMTGHSNIAAASFSDQTRAYLITTGAQPLPNGAVGHVYVFGDTLPEADGYLDNDVAVVKSGSQRGIWTKESESDSGAADTGWRGRTLDIGPQGNLQPVDVVANAVTFRHNRYAGAAYRDPRGTAQIAAGGRSPGVPQLAYIDLSYVAQGQGQARIDIKYLAARTYMGRLSVQTIGGIQYAVLVPRVDATTWSLVGIDVGTVRHLLGAEIEIIEVDHADTTVVHRWVLTANSVSQRITQSAYDGLTTKDAGVQYLVIG